MKKLLIIFILLTNQIHGREIGETEITTEEGIEVYQKEKYYLLKKNVDIKSDNFNLIAQKVKAFFEKDLYDIVDIHSSGDVKLTSSKGIIAKGEIINFNIKSENIFIKGKKSYLNNVDFEMLSDESIYVDNLNGKFKLTGLNSKILTEETKISGSFIEGTYINIDGENVVQNLYVEDDTQVNIKTQTLNMYSLKGDYEKKTDTIELFENVKIFRGGELITGDYAKINTVDESYYVTSDDTKKVKVLLKKTDE